MRLMRRNMATRANLAKAFADARSIKPQDVLVVFLAGHGAALRTGNSLYCYLTQNANTGDIASLEHDATLRSATTISSEDLTEWTKLIPARKQVLVLDTCAAGAAAAQLASRDGDNSDQVRAVDRLKDRTGFWVLMGCAGDKYSYESPTLSEGVLTYSLLQYMHQGTLENEDVDVGKMFEHQRRTRQPDLLAQISERSTEDVRSRASSLRRRTASRLACSVRRIRRRSRCRMPGRSFCIRRWWLLVTLTSPTSKVWSLPRCAK